MAARIRADEPHPMPLQRAVFHQVHGAIQRRLPPERGQERIRLLAGDNFLHHLGGNRLHVGPRGELRVGHDRGRVRVHQHHLVALFRQGFAGLHPGVIELAPLADHDRAGANKENLAQTGIAGHGQKLQGSNRGRRGAATATRKICLPPRSIRSVNHGRRKVRI